MDSTGATRGDRQVRHHRARLLLPLALAGLLIGCATPDPLTDRGPLVAELQQRTWHDLPVESCPAETVLPPEVLLGDGLSEEEAVAIALWNNAQFHATLSQLGMARGDIVQAGLLTNPQFTYLFGGGDKQLEYVLYLPLEAMFFREHRITIAEQQYCRIAQELVQNGLNLVRDVRVAYADLVFAVDRVALAEEATQVRLRIAEFSDKRLEAGDISELEVMTARIEAQRARVDAAGLREQVVIARERLANLLGVGLLNVELIPSDPHPTVPAALEPEILLAEALVSRPDLRAAQYAIAAANQQARLSRWTWLRVDAVADGNAGGSGASNFGPGIRLDIPIFNRNQGGIIRSDWTTDQALQNFHTIEDRVVMEVRTALAQLRQADGSLSILQADVLPPLRDAVDVAQQAYRNGGTTYFLALQTASQLLDARAQELQLQADGHRALAELERSVGRRLVIPATEFDLNPATEFELFPAVPSIPESTDQDSDPQATLDTRFPGLAQTSRSTLVIGLLTSHNALTAYLTAEEGSPTALNVAKTSDTLARVQQAGHHVEHVLPEEPPRSSHVPATFDWPDAPRWRAVSECAAGSPPVDCSTGGVPARRGSAVGQVGEAGETGSAAAGDQPAGRPSHAAGGAAAGNHDRTR